MATSYSHDDTVDPPFNHVQGLNLDDERTQAILRISRAFAKKYPRIDKREMFSSFECLSISAVLNRRQPEINSTKDEVDHILSVSYQMFRDYCSLMCHGLLGVTENLRFNCKTGQVYPLATKDRRNARTFYAIHQSTIQNFDILRSIFLYTWDHYFGDEGVHPYAEVGGDPLEIANDPPMWPTWDQYLGEGVNPHTEVGDVNPHTEVGGDPPVIGNDPPMNNALQQTNKRARDDSETDDSSDSETVPSTPPAPDATFVN